MKYLFFLLTFFAVATAHSQCNEFDRLLREGDSYLKKTNYQEAINSYTTAIIACSGRAGEAKQRITRMVNEINKLREKAQTALANLEKANADVAKLILENADRDILNLRYEDALQKIKAAASLGGLKPEVAKAYLEIAFWYGETGNAQRAKNILDSALLLVNKKTDTGQPHRKAIEAFDPVTYAKLMERYYPVMVQVEGGIFDMGCDPGDTCIDLHKQEIGSFQMAKYETTWWQYYLFCVATGHEYESPGWGTEGDNPAVNVNWFDAVEYCNWSSKQLGKTEAIIKTEDGKYAMSLRGGYRLPTEAEWEYACRAGCEAPRYGELRTIAASEASGKYFGPVGMYEPNKWGLLDMLGLVFEWCADVYARYQPLSQVDPLRGLEGDETPETVERVLRGGCYQGPDHFARASARASQPANVISLRIGFRVVLARYDSPGPGGKFP